MPVHNREIAEIFRKVADLLAVEGEKEFLIRTGIRAGREAPNFP